LSRDISTLLTQTERPINSQIMDQGAVSKNYFTFIVVASRIGRANFDVCDGNHVILAHDLRRRSRDNCQNNLAEKLPTEENRVS